MIQFSSSWESQQSRFSAHSDRKTSHLISYGGFNVFALAVLVSLWRQTVCNISHLTMKTGCSRIWNNEWLNHSSWICGYIQANRSEWVISVTTLDKYTETHIKYYLLTSGLVCTILSVWVPDFKSTGAYLHQNLLDAQLFWNLLKCIWWGEKKKKFPGMIIVLLMSHGPEGEIVFCLLFCFKNKKVKSRISW